MNRFSRNTLIALGSVAVVSTLVIGLRTQFLRTTVDVRSSGFPACSDIAGAIAESPCAVVEGGKIFLEWNGVTFKPGSAPTPFPVPYRAQSIHPDIVTQASYEGIVLDINDYDEVYVGIVHNHFPLECDGDLFCSEVWYHRFDSDRYASQFNSDREQMQKRGINYVQVDGIWYLDGLDQLFEPTPVRPTSTALSSTPEK